MKKITALFIVLFALQLSYAHAQPLDCPAPADSLDPLGSNNTKSIKALLSPTKISACDTDSIFSKVDDPKFIINHNRHRCEEIENCLGGQTNIGADKNATESLKEHLPKAILLGVIEREIKAKLEFTIHLENYEKSHHEKLCPVEKVEASCEKDIRNAISSVVGSFIDYPGLLIAPSSKESIAKYFSENFSKEKKFQDASLTKEKLSDCSKKISFKEICHLRDLRSSDIVTCEKDPESQGCLNLEQKALASLLNSQKDNRENFLAMEKQLCTSSRLVLDLASKPIPGSAVLSPSIFGAQKRSYVGIYSEISNYIARAATETPVAIATPVFSEAPIIAVTAPDVKLPDEGPKVSDASLVVRPDSAAMDMPPKGSPPPPPPPSMPPGPSHGPMIEERVLGGNDPGEIISKSPSVSMNTPTSNSVNNWNSDFYSHINDQNEEENKKKEKTHIADGPSSGTAEQKAKEEMSALTAKISDLKAKLEGMNQNVEDLKVKQEASKADADKNKIEKDSLEKEKTILDLKKKLAELEADKKKKQEDSVIKSKEENRLKTERVQEVNNKVAASFQNRSDSEQANLDKREREKLTNVNTQSSGHLSEARVQAPIPSYQPSASAIVLHSIGTQATPDSSVVYMTDAEVKKYPYHLNALASPGEIEKMLLGNNGASIILGDSEQLIPVTEKGVVLLDENGRVKYKRVKISLVKNEKEKKQKIAHEISSVADLKREDQKKRDLIRYQEMKKAIKKATE